ncbi:MAG: alpha/beta hydrolase [Chloroflexota bacterium]|nr:alpha/beta hydrolase [Chloroflexota bacterium]
MQRRTFVAGALATGTSLAVSTLGFAQTDADPATPLAQGGEMTEATFETGYAPVNGLDLYYEIHGSGGVPLVLLHGAYTTINTSFGAVLPGLAATRQVIAIEQQGHGHTADIDRPLTYERMADDTAALLRHLGIEHADVFGYSMGGTTALALAIQHPDLIRKLVIAGSNFNNEGLYPEILGSIAQITPAVFAGSPIQEEYDRVAPDPDGFPALVDKLKQLDLEFAGLATEDLRTINAPSLIIIGDADAVRPEHAIELFRLLGGGVAGDVVGLPRSRLAVLPGTTHVGLVFQAEWLLSMISAFLDAPMPEAD